jgi:DNA-binding MarR family transcriptional regulator
VSAITPNQWTILEALKSGPRWLRSFQTVKPLVNDLIDRGLVERCRPHLGRANNMARLTASGCAALEIDPATVPAMRDEPKPNSKAFAPRLGAIRSDASELCRETCEAFAAAIGRGATSGEAVSELAARYDVQRPAIWKRLRDGGLIAPYAPRQNGGKGRPLGGGTPGYTATRRERSKEHHEQLEARPLPPRIDRDPCPRCGVRGDIGCAHSRVPIGTAFF